MSRRYPPPPHDRLDDLLIRLRAEARAVPFDPELPARVEDAIRRRAGSAVRPRWRRLVRGAVAAAVLLLAFVARSRPPHARTVTSLPPAPPLALPLPPEAAAALEPRPRSPPARPENEIHDADLPRRAPP